MLPIGIDIGEIVEEFALTEGQGRELATIIIDKIAEGYANEWSNVIRDGLGSTRKQYQQAMSVERVSENEVVFGLTDSPNNPLPMMIEEGCSAFDQKEGFANSSKKKKTKMGGWYVTVPFRHATPDAVAESEAFSSVMPKDIYKLAKNADRPLKLEDLPSKHRGLGVREEITTELGVKIPEYTHKSAKYEGLVRKDISSTNEEQRSGYYTFRRVSSNSDPNSWIHSGFQPHKFMEKAIEKTQIDTVVDMAVDNYLQNI